METSNTISILGLELPLIALIPLLPIFGSLLNLTVFRKASRSTVHTVAIGAVAAACGLALYLVFGPLWHAYSDWRASGGDGGFAGLPDANVYTWIEVGSLKVQLAFRLDTLSAVMILIITFVGTLIHIYSAGYMAHDPRYAAYFGYLNLFTGAMLILVLGANIPVMFIGWEGVGLCSFLLIGFWFENEAFANAGRKAFIVNRIGDFCFLLGMFLLYWAVKDVRFADGSLAAARGSLDFAQLRDPATAHAYAEVPFWFGNRLAAAAGILMFVGACGKSAQIPLYVWLPDAMAGPTPVSALIHAATMVTAGVYMIARLSFLYAASTTALAVVAIIGTLTALAAAFMAFAQTDLKKVLAYSTVSQLGFMFVAAGTGNWTAAIFHLGTHAFFKAGLFLGAGSVMHGMEHGGSHTPGDIRTMGGLRKHMPWTRATFFIYCLAIAGVPLFSGFFSKDEILAGVWQVTPPDWPPFLGKLLWGGLTVAALGTAFYMWRLYFLVFGGEERSEEAKHAHESPATMVAPLVVLAVLATVAGLIGAPELEGLHLPHWMHALEEWLAPALTHQWHEGTPIRNEMSDATTIGLMAFATAMGLFGIGLAKLLYGGKAPSPSVGKLVAEHGPLAGLYSASKHKLWVDEIYEAIFIRPFRALARGVFEVVDRFVIDTVAVNGSAAVVGLFSRVSRWVQNGQVQRYLSGVVVGGALVFWVTNCHNKPTFEYALSAKGDQLVLHALPGAGVAGATAKLRWDLDGDGKPDHEGPTVTVRPGDVGGKVTLWIDDQVNHETIEVTREIKLTGAAPQGGK
jgi:NADH-quinone oxidoreductase subunit L